jgi:hypothetical protein
MNAAGWRPCTLRLLSRLEIAQWRWVDSPSRLGGKALISPRGTKFDWRARPMSLRKFDPTLLRANDG